MHAGYACAFLLLTRRCTVGISVCQPLIACHALQGNTEDVGEDYNVEAADDAPRPFQVRFAV